MADLAQDQSVVQRILDHIDAGTTDLSETTWREPVEHYRSDARLAAEIEQVFRRHPTPFCPAAALPEPGSYVAREAAGTPIVVVRDRDGRVRGFRNACRHRGMQVAEGAGCTRVFACPYHGWTYGLEGRLRHVPHEHGFPGLDRDAHGLVPVTAVERHGLVFVTQDEPARPEPALDALPDLLAGLTVVRSNQQELAANWKVLMDGFLEGYHIRPTHRETFYPVQFDNLNVVETFGRNSRVAFPYRNIEKLRDTPVAARSATGVLTFVYHLFPNVIVATFPTNVLVGVNEPLAPDRTLASTWVLADARAVDDDSLEPAGDFVLAGAQEDNAIACAIQRSLGSGANEHFEFGRFEGAVTHFHRALEEALEEGP
jgi:phenylpropionate dioxygenase-like ring-hydroxylating dioxygenase large terminal subunit